MSILILIPIIIITATATFLAINRPVWLLAGYLIAVPLLPPLPIGHIELSVLDLLTLPALIRILFNFAKSGFSIRGLWAKGFLAYLLAALISFMSFSLQHSVLSSQILFRLIRLVELALPILLAAQSLESLKRRSAVILFLLGGGLSAIAGLGMFLSGISLRTSQAFVLEGISFFRAGGTHGDSGSFGNLMSITTLISIWALIYVVRKKDWKLTLLAVTTGIICLLGLVVSLSRGGIILLGIGVLILLLPLLVRPRLLIKAAVIVGLLIIVGLGIGSLRADNHLIAATVGELWERMSGLGELTSSVETVTSSRTTYWAIAWDHFQNNPLAWPFGLGYKALKYYYSIPPDNNFLQALFELGIFGLGAFVMLIIAGLIAGLKSLRINLTCGIIVLAIWLGLISNMLSADVLTYWHNTPAVFLFLMVLSRTPELMRNRNLAEGKAS